MQRKNDVKELFKNFNQHQIVNIKIGCEEDEVILPRTELRSLNLNENSFAFDRSHLTLLKAENIIAPYFYIDGRHLNTFIKEWINNERNTLKYAKIGISSHEGILSGITTVEYAPGRNPHFFKNDFMEDELTVDHGIDIINENKKVATVLVHSATVHIVVW